MSHRPIGIGVTVDPFSRSTGCPSPDRHETGRATGSDVDRDAVGDDRAVDPGAVDGHGP